MVSTSFLCTRLLIPSRLSILIACISLLILSGSCTEEEKRVYRTHIPDEFLKQYGCFAPESYWIYENEKTKTLDTLVPHEVYYLPKMDYSLTGQVSEYQIRYAITNSFPGPNAWAFYIFVYSATDTARFVNFLNQAKADSFFLARYPASEPLPVIMTSKWQSSPAGEYTDTMIVKTRVGLARIPLPGKNSLRLVESKIVYIR